MMEQVDDGKVIKYVIELLHQYKLTQIDNNNISLVFNYTKLNLINIPYYLIITKIHNLNKIFLVDIFDWHKIFHIFLDIINPTPNIGLCVINNNILFTTLNLNISPNTINTYQVKNIKHLTQYKNPHIILCFQSINNLYYSINKNYVKSKNYIPKINNIIYNKYKQPIIHIYQDEDKLIYSKDELNKTTKIHYDDNLQTYKI